jgi:hypothetical protein
MQTLRWHWVALRFVLALTALTALGIYQGQAIIAAVLPLLRWTFEHLADQYRVVEFGLAATATDHVIQLKVTLARIIMVGTHPVYPNPDAHATISTLSAHVLQPWIVGLASLLAWPVNAMRVIRELTVRFAMGALLLSVVTAIDVPVLLVAELSDIFTSAFAPGEINLLTLWVRFLEEGGRYVLGIAAAWVAVAVQSGNGAH